MGGAVSAPNESADVSGAKILILELITKDDETRTDGSSIAPTLMKLAFNASATYSIHDNTGGCNGATMRNEPECSWSCNRGLYIARDFLQPVKQKFPELSYADIWTLASVVAIELLGGPAIPWRNGRVDTEEPSKCPEERIAKPSKGSSIATAAHLREIFNNYGFNDREIVALMGGHGVGRCRKDSSGYSGSWTHTETVFSNQYYKTLLFESWIRKKTPLNKTFYIAPGKHN